MARAKVLTVKQSDVMRLEGCAQQLAEMDPKDRPKAEAADYVAQKLGVRRSLVQEWVRLTRPATMRGDTAGAFISVFDRIATLLSEKLYANMWSLATPGERDAFKALMWLLPRVDPGRFDPTAQEQDGDEDDVFDTSSVSQEVFDRIAENEDYRERLAQLRQTIHAAMEEYETLIRTVQSELMAEDLAERKSTTTGAH